MAASLAQGALEGEAARHEHPRLRRQRETIPQSLRAIGYAYHCVDLERGGRRTSTRTARDLHAQLDTMRPIAPQEGLSRACLDRIEQAERVVPTLPAPIACVSGRVADAMIEA